MGGNWPESGQILNSRITCSRSRGVFAVGKFGESAISVRVYPGRLGRASVVKYNQIFP